MNSTWDLYWFQYRQTTTSVPLIFLTLVGWLLNISCSKTWFISHETGGKLIYLKLDRSPWRPHRFHQIATCAPCDDYVAMMKASVPPKFHWRNSGYQMGFNTIKFHLWYKLGVYSGLLVWLITKGNYFYMALFFKKFIPKLNLTTYIVINKHWTNIKPTLRETELFTFQKCFPMVPILEIIGAMYGHQWGIAVGALEGLAKSSVAKWGAEIGVWLGNHISYE